MKKLHLVVLSFINGLVTKEIASNIKVAKMSGRGLGHTGGTIDKLESIPGFKTSVDSEAFVDQINSIYMAVAGQTANLAPADKKIYALAHEQLI